MDEVKLGMLRVTWDAGERLLRIVFAGPTPDPVADRALLSERLRAWTEGTEPYTVLASCAPDVLVDLRWRVFWADFFAKDRDRARIACHGLNAADRFFLRATNTMFRIEAEAFGSEQEARAWLDGADITDGRRPAPSPG